VKIPCYPVAVIRGIPPKNHWETGKDSGVMILEPENLPVIIHVKLYER
jgi:hypothetical protein